MKISNIVILVAFLTSNFVHAEELPDKAQEILKKLEQHEERAQKELERDIVKKKKDVLKAVERSAKKIDNEGILKLYDKVISDFKREIAASEAIIEGKAVVNFIKYDTVYHYEHPAAQIFKQRGELTFFKDGKVKMQHINDKDKVVFDETWKWEFDDGKLIILDGTHGNIEVSASPRNDSSRVILNWTRFSKTIRAKTEK